MLEKNSVFVKPADITAVRMECKSCSSVVILSFAHPITFDHFTICPNCGTPWLAVMGTTIIPQVQKCAEAIKELASFMDTWKNVLNDKKSKGFSLSLEVSGLSDRALTDKD
jgi:hypothetical protein